MNKVSSKGTKAAAYKIGTKTQKFLDDCKMFGMEVTLPKKYNTWFCSELNIPITDPVVAARSKLVEEFKTDSTNPMLLKNMRTDSAKAKINYFIDYLLYHIGISFSKITNATPHKNGTHGSVEFIGITIRNEARTFTHTHEHYDCSMSRDSAKRVLEALEKLEYVRTHLGKKNPSKQHGNPTAIAPMTKLLDLLVQYKAITNSPAEVTNMPLVCIKSDEGDVTEVNDDESKGILIEQNRLIAGTDIDLPLDTYDEYVDCYTKAYVSGGLIRRIYSKELDQSGRFYHGYSGCPSRYRNLITFDGEPTIELDYQASQVNVAYSLNGLDAQNYNDGDPYLPINADPKHRSVYKALLIRSFTIANPIRSVKDDKDIKKNGLNLTEMLDQIWQMHRYISNHRHKEAYKTVAFEESRVALKVIELCNEQGITVLPIHDSFIVKKQHKQTLEDMMVEAYEVLGFVSVPKVTGG